MAVALSVRVSTTRPQPTQTMAHQIERLRGHVAAPPPWPLAEAHRYGDEGSSGATRNRPSVDRWRDRAACAAFARVLITAPERLACHDVPQRLRSDAFTQRGGRSRPGSSDA